MQQERSAPDPRLLLFVAVAAQVIVGGDFSLTSMAMPLIEHRLGVSPAISQWVLTAYIVAYAGILIVGGRLADAFGQKATLMVGLALFLGGSILTSLSPDIGMLLGARAIQGLGGALIYPSAFSILTLAFPAGEKRFKAYTISMASQAVGTPVLTMIAGGAITQFGWRSSFLLNVPVCLILLFLLTRIGRVGERSPGAERVQIPYFNAVILTCAMASMIYALSSFVAKAESLRAAAPYALGIALALTLLFVIVERRTSMPLIPPPLVRIRNFAAGVALAAVMVLVGKGIVVLSNISFQKALHFTPLQASYALLPMAVASLLLIPLSPLTGRFILPFPKRSLIGIFATLASFYLLLSLTPATIAFVVLLTMLFLTPFASVTGVNMALNEALKSVPSDQQGVATAIIYTAVQMITAVGMAILIAASDRSTDADEFARFAPSFQVGFGFCLFAIVIAVLGFRSGLSSPLPKNVVQARKA